MPLNPQTVGEREDPFVLFNSYIFIFLFLPLCLIGWFGLNHFRKSTLAQIFLLGMSLWFYGYFNPSYLGIIITSITFNFCITRILSRTRASSLRKVEVILAVAVNLGILFYYKYFDFFLENINVLAHADFTLRHILLPLGISFFTFQQLSYVLDAYHREVPQYSFLLYASYVSFFPQLIAGPIVTHDELIPQFMDLAKRQFSWDNFSKGMYMFILGLSKKVLIADVFGQAANWGFGNIELLDTLNAILVSLAYTIQIYFDFSGYSDMAIGLGKMMNFDIPVNFNSPYKSLTITEFWRRWHITLTRFFTKYVYIPLGGNRRGTMRTYCNILAVFLASGLWHGASWAFVLWGFLHGALNVITRHFHAWIEKLPKALLWSLTFVFLDLTWILFRCENIPDALRFFQRLATGQFGPIRAELSGAFLQPEFEFVFSHIPFLNLFNIHPELFLLVWFGGAMMMLLIPRNAYQHMERFHPTGWNLLGCVILIVWCVMSFSGVSTFLYFNF